MDEQSLSTINPSNDSSQPEKKAPRKRPVYDPFHLIGDLARSSCKSVVWRGDENPVFIKLPSILKQIEEPPEHERGGYTLIKEYVEKVLDEDGKPVLDDKNKPKTSRTQITEHWIVGDRALSYPNPIIVADDVGDSKIIHFHLLLCGVIACIPTLHEMSTGTTVKARTLTINLTTLSIAFPSQLRRALKDCKYLVKDGIKYRLNFTAEQRGYPEGYGAVFAGRSEAPDAATLYVADLGAGTFQLTEYSLLAKTPQKSSPDSLHGGGGIQALKEIVFDALSNADTSKGVTRSHAAAILEDCTWLDDRCYAKNLENKEVGECLYQAIGLWLRETIAGKAVERLNLLSRRYPIIFCGGGFKIGPVKEIIQRQIIESGGKPENLIFPAENIEILGVMGVYHYLNDLYKASHNAAPANVIDIGETATKAHLSAVS